MDEDTLVVVAVVDGLLVVGVETIDIVYFLEGRT